MRGMKKPRKILAGMKFNKLKTYYLISYYSASIYREYPLEFFMAILNRVLSYSSLLLFWFITARFSSVQFSVNEIITYYLYVASVGELILGIGIGPASHIAKDSKYGQLSAKLLLPIKEIGYYVAHIIGQKMHFNMLAVALLVVAVAVNPPNLSLGLGLMLIPLLISAISINISFNKMVAAIAIRTIDPSGIKNIFAHIIRFAGGFLIPLSLLPVLAQAVLFSLPFANSIYIPVALLTGRAVPPYAIVLGILWGFMLPVIAEYAWRRSLKYYEAVGL